MKDRNPELAELLSHLSPTGRNPEQAALLKVCVWCGGNVLTFKDKLSEKEYSITGFCQKCQDDLDSPRPE